PDEEPEPASTRIPSLALHQPKTPTKRRGSALLTLSEPDDEDVPPSSRRGEPPASTQRPIGAAKEAAKDDSLVVSPRPDPRREEDLGAHHMRDLPDATV